MFALFAGFNYYPSGGFDDFRGKFDTVEEAVEVFKTGFYDDGRFDDFCFDTVEEAVEFFKTEFYKDGRFDDFRGKFDTVEEAVEFFKTFFKTGFYDDDGFCGYDWGHVVDLTSCEKVTTLSNQ